VIRVASVAKRKDEPFAVYQMALDSNTIAKMGKTSVGRLSLMIVACAMVIGCGPKSDRLKVTGDVTLNGAPLDGSIRFVSSGGGKLVASGTSVENGKFTVPQEKGLPPGKYVVEISSPDTSAPPVRSRSAPGEPALPPTAPERVPAEYSTEGKHTIDVTAGGDNHFTFDIHSRNNK
jgi:hypothetical protein